MSEFDLVSQNRISGIINAVRMTDISLLYASLRGTDERVRDALIRFLLHNPVPGWQKALSFLSQGTDALASVRSAAVCLLVNNLRGKTNADVQSAGSVIPA